MMGAGEAAATIKTVAVPLLMAAFLAFPPRTAPADPDTEPPPSAIPASTDAPSPDAPDDPLDAMLAAFGLTRETLAPDPLALLLRTRRSLASPLALRLMLRPLEAPYMAGHLAAQHRRWSHSVVRTLLHSVGSTPAEIARGYIGNPLREADARLIEAESPLLAGAEAVWQVAVEHGFGTEATGLFVSTEAAEPSANETISAAPLPAATLSTVALPSTALPVEMPSDLRAAWLAAAEALGPVWGLELGRLLMAAAAAARWQDKAFADLDDESRERLRRVSTEGFSPAADLRRAIAKTDFEFLYAGALDLAAAVEDFEHFLESDPPPFQGDFDLDTPLGRVVLRGGNDDNLHDTDPPVHVLLLVDRGGDDVYGPGLAIGGMAYPVQLIFDLDGDDTYHANPRHAPSWGGAVAGYAFLLDRAGNDRYEGTFVTQGAGVLGVGVLIDRGGDDRFLAHSHAQGYGLAGIGLLHNVAGDDRYEAFTRAQGCGDSLGAGTLFDESGNDRYILNNETILYPSPQTREHNTSMGQGTGAGHRADLADGHSLPGGVGLLYDVEGDDVYTAGVFAQGCGFLGGAGLLLDDAGDDVYRGVYYVQGASAHRGAGILIDRRGNDVYEATMQCAQGCGHDLGVGWLLDLEGDDRYTAGRLAQGAANDNGFGFLVDLGGDDTYALTAPAYAADGLGAAKLGRWGTLREDIPAFGLFLDAGGRDTYTGRADARDNAQWTWKREHPDEAFRSERAIGRDGEYPSVRLPTGPRSPASPRDLDEYAAQQTLRRRYRETVAPSPTR